MFGPRITTVFRSRWNAVFWSAGMLLTAYCSVPAPEDTQQQGDTPQVAAQAAGQSGEHKNPWSKD